MCYKVKLINPGIMLQAMLTEGAIKAVISETLEKYNMSCEDIVIAKYEWGDEKLMGEEMTPAQYRAMKKKRK